MPSEGDLQLTYFKPTDSKGHTLTNTRARTHNTHTHTRAHMHTYTHIHITRTHAHIKVSALTRASSQALESSCRATNSPPGKGTTLLVIVSERKLEELIG